MTLFEPLRALRPPPELAGEVAELPYDVMNRAEAQAMAAGRPHSFLHVSRPDIDLPEMSDPDGDQALASARNAFDRLQRDGYLVRDTAPAYQAYRLTRDGVAQTGVVGLGDVAAYDCGRIRRHELTRPDKQAGRAAHIEALDAQTGPVFLLHRPAPLIAAVLGEVTATPAPTALRGPGGVVHELWPIDDPEHVAALRRAFDDQDALYIADGHHRSAAASAVHAVRGGPATAGFLAVSFPADEVTLLPYHRVARASDGVGAQEILAGVGAVFDVAQCDGPVTATATGRFGMYLAGRWYDVRVPEAMRHAVDPADRLDVARLQRHVLGPVLRIENPRSDPRIGFVGGIRPVGELQSAVDSGIWTVAFTLHPTTVADLLAVCDNGGIMPPKSTWFEPKLLDGLVCHVLD